MENNCVYGKSFFSHFTEINILQEWKCISFHLFNFTGISSLLFVNVNVSLCITRFYHAEGVQCPTFCSGSGIQTRFHRNWWNCYKMHYLWFRNFVRFCLSPNRNRLIFKNVEMLNVLKYNSFMFFFLLLMSDDLM